MLTVFTKTSIVSWFTLTNEPISTACVINTSCSIFTLVSKHGACCSKSYEKVKHAGYSCDSPSIESEWIIQLTAILARDLAFIVGIRIPAVIFQISAV